MTEHATSTDHPTYKQLRRSQSDRMVAGVCGGLGRYFDVNPTFYRVGFIVLALLGGAGLLIYGAAVLVMPDEGRDESIVEEAFRNHRDHPARLVGIGIVSVAAIALLSHARIWPHGDIAWVLLLLAGVSLLAARRGTEPAPAVSVPPDTGGPGPLAPAPAPTSPRRSFPLSLVALGVLVVAAGALAALSSWGVDVPWSVVLAVAAVTVGVALVGGAFLHLRVGGLVVIGLVLGIAAILASTIDVKLNDGIGDREYAPTTVAGLKDEYRLGIGELRLDLGKLALPAGKTHVDAGVGIGELHVIVPPKASVRVESHVGWGDSEVLGEDDNGHDVDATVIRPAGGGAPNLVIDAHVGAGHIDVQRAAA